MFLLEVAFILYINFMLENLTIILFANLHDNDSAPRFCFLIVGKDVYIFFFLFGWAVGTILLYSFFFSFWLDHSVHFKNILCHILHMSRITYILLKKLTSLPFHYDLFLL